MLSIASITAIKANLTSDLIAGLLALGRDFVPCEYETVKKAQHGGHGMANKNVGNVFIKNESGLDFYISQLPSIYDDDTDRDIAKDDDSLILLRHGNTIVLNLTESDKFDDNLKVVLIPSPDSVHLIGERKPIVNIPIPKAGERSSRTFPLFPKQGPMHAKVYIEPVVEWCMQNQRIHSACNNLSCVDIGVDLLSNKIWSPSDRLLVGKKEEHWLPPYLDGDVNEWTDMTGVLRMERDRVMLPDTKWIWANDWTVETPCGYGDNVDADGWEYAKDFRSFGLKSRFYEEGDNCRRRRWTRTRLMKPPKYDDPDRPLAIVWNCFKDGHGNDNVKLRSPITVSNTTQLDLIIFCCSHSWKNDQLLGCVRAGEELVVPLHLTCMTHFRISIRLGDEEVVTSSDQYCSSDYILAIPSSVKFETIVRVSVDLNDIVAKELNLPKQVHFTVTMNVVLGCTQIVINPVVRLINLLPCPLQVRFCEGAVDGTVDNQEYESCFLDEQSLEVGLEISSIAVDATLNPFVSFRVPGYRWSRVQRIVNRKFALSSWKPDEDDAKMCFKHNESKLSRAEYSSVVQFERLNYGGDPLTLILEVVPSDCPLIRIFAQYWIVDKTGFGLRFCDGAGDLLGKTLKTNSPRRSYLLHKEMQNEPFINDMEVEGHEWTIGKDGRTIYFSCEDKVATCIDIGNPNSHDQNQKLVRSNWSDLIDISNVIPKAVFSVSEYQGERQFDLSYDVAFAPSIFSKTKVVTIYNRFHLVNLSEHYLYVSQDQSSDATSVPPKGTVPFHWDNKTWESKVRFSIDKKMWTTGCVQLDKVGVMALRLPNEKQLAMVIQTEIRLAKNDYDSAVVILLWFANDQTNPLYLLRNKSSHEIKCYQSHEDSLDGGTKTFAFSGCGDSAKTNQAGPWNSNVFDLVSDGINCGLTRNSENIESDNFFTYNVPKRDSSYFGFDDPTKTHIIEWTCGDIECTRAKVDVDALGSSNVVSLPFGGQIGCLVIAEHSTKVIEFFDIYDLENLKDKWSYQRTSLSHNKLLVAANAKGEEHDAFTVNITLPGIHVSCIENSSVDLAGREIFLVYIDKIVCQVSQTRDGHHELELQVLSLQIDNHVNNAIHAVMLSCPQSDDDEQFLHVSAVRKLQNDSTATMFRYFAFRMLAVDISLDRWYVQDLS